jgi:hypothetical protein
VRGVERAERGVAVAGGGEGFAVGGGEPCPQQRRPGAGERTRVIGLLGGVSVLAERSQDEALFGGGVREQRRGLGFAGGLFGAFVVLPGLGVVVAVEGLPAGEGGCFGERGGEGRAVTGGGAVGEQALCVVDVLAELVELGKAAELAVESAGVLDLGAEGGDGGGVDGAGGGDAGAQLVGGSGGVVVGEAEFGVGAAVDLAERRSPSGRASS